MSVVEIAAAPPGDDVVSKGAFAKLIGVTPGRISQMLADGQIDAEAIEGSGRFAKIRVRVATEQLKRRLDIGQRLGNGLDTRLKLTPTAAVGQTKQAQSPTADAADSIEERIKQERLRSYEYDNRKRREDELARRGLFTLTADVVAQNDRMVGDILKSFEGSLADMASAIAAEFEIPQRDVLHVLIGQFRAYRARQSRRLHEQAENLPALVEFQDAAE